MTPPAASIDPPDEFRRVDAFGMVLDGGRGSLPFVLVHGEPLVACAAWSLGEAGVQLLDLGTPWADLADEDRPLVLADPLCPLTPPDFVAACVELAESSGAVVVGVRPVTDTVKQVVDGYVGATVDRTGLLQVASPVVLPAEVVGSLGELPTEDLAELVAGLSTWTRVETLLAPPQARRIASAADVRVLEASSSQGPRRSARTVG